MAETKEPNTGYIPTGDLGLTKAQRDERATAEAPDAPKASTDATGRASVPERLPGVSRLAKAEEIARRHGPKHTTSHNTTLSEVDIAEVWDDRAKSNKELVNTAAEKGDTDAQAAIARYKGQHRSDEK